MTEAVFAADPARLLIAAAAGILLLLLLIIKFKIHPVLSLADHCTDHRTRSRHAGSDSGRYSRKRSRRDTAGNCIADRPWLIVRRDTGSIGRSTVRCADIGEPVWRRKRQGLLLELQDLLSERRYSLRQVLSSLIPLAFGLAKKTKKSTLYYVIPLLAGLATGFAFIPPSAGSVLVANMLGVDLGVMIAVGVPTGILSLIFAGILWSKFIGTKIHTGSPGNRCQR